MKKSIVFFGSLLCLLILTACPEPAETLYSRSFVLAYYEVDGIDIEYVKEGLGYRVGFNTTSYCDIKSKDVAKQTYDALCEKYGDVTYNREVYFHRMFVWSRCAASFTGFKVTSTAAWDEDHPTDSNLSDIVRFFGETPLPYIRSGYTKRYSEDKDGEYYPIDKLVSELTHDDMTLLSSFYLRFTHAPTLARQHTLTFTLTDDEGVEYSASVDVDFDALDPK